MKSLLRFLLFVLIAAAAVGSVYIWKQTRPSGVGEAEPAAQMMAPLRSSRSSIGSSPPWSAGSCLQL